MKKIIELDHWKFKIAGLNFEKEVVLPHTWNVDENMDVQLYRGKAEYKTVIPVTNLDSKTAILYFGAVFHTAELFINGKSAGIHTGSGYTPFEFNITDYLFPGENEIKVITDNEKKEEMLPHMLDYDWADDGGLIRNVMLKICDNTDLLDMKVTYSVKSMTDTACSGSININICAVMQDVQIKVIDCKTNETMISKAAFADSGVSIDFENLKLWDISNPNLYMVTVQSENDELSKRIGFRTIEVHNVQVLLNGKPIYMKGCEWMPGSHPDYGMAEPLEHSIKRLSQLKAAGCVFTRFHWQQDDSVFDWCDENGLLVQEEIPYWGYPKKAASLQLELAKMQADEMVHYHSHHPSIICWGMGNELGGEFDETISYVKQMYQFFKSADASRLVNYVSNSVSRDTNVELDDATMYGDIAMWNEYLGLWQPCDNIEDVIARTYNKIGNMPSMVTEFGLCEPAFAGGDERRSLILLERIPIYKKFKNMVGYVWFSLNDYRTHCGEFGEGKLKQRIHGSTDLYGNEKKSYKIFSDVE
nr:glycoside hydrolase family 2 TIM barrel-domain containing protein [uncultured Clostridium sp.]